MKKISFAKMASAGFILTSLSVIFVVAALVFTGIYIIHTAKNLSAVQMSFFPFTLAGAILAVMIPFAWDEITE